MCFMETNKLFGYYNEVLLFVFPAALVFSKMNMFLLLSLPNMIIDAVRHCVGSRWVRG